MPREVILVDWCDSCFAVDLKKESIETFTLSTDGAEWTYLACEEHSAPVRQALDLVQAHGTRPAPPKKRLGRPPKGDVPAVPVEPSPCPMPGCQHVSPNGKARRQHVKQKHKLTVNEFRTRFPDRADML